jgi:hypothetical protein
VVGELLFRRGQIVPGLAFDRPLTSHGITWSTIRKSGNRQRPFALRRNARTWPKLPARATAAGPCSR